MKVFNGTDSNGGDTGEVIVLLSKKEAQELIKLAELSADIDEKSVSSRKRDLRRLGKTLFNNLNLSAICF